ncbi:uncharacterized protein LOC118463120 [Anopheles albimanus]|uniref:uncharacterized protein LOC118463120 n=1 Tax=Anopheles albimanus TaxID=7167 RepID=UPI0016412B0C|nr:uncharacterized protein LOC118463120 [Anopheles albimanus]XP_035785348.1 uncharacterized protein LOC118463120 [Anopheles albimanus]XP_035785349.1 uncharacterized protein LOC118463120 [Anopheles albimanus]XP_035785350.1 uncharacterized protein LOC118463120 [Anopheles albimanus]XP_035785351.1 uncharacterized protein LOC118463120 [Anopheles albimanus]XP_035785352.1 uncharacterized protein LOC118463120 [Anopheles albimanus]XP_035785354.1 uncharacterized protein LOC118463120 [Anopheles albimanu
MKKIRRWLLLFAVIIALMVRVDGLKATSLIFGRGPATTTTTTTTSTTTAATSTTEESAEAEDEVAEQGEDGATKAPLTGIPQVDYVWDPNLPRELRGFNLSNYPFLDSVPTEEDIGFTCDPKLHDGFYASIKYNCQLYHHCINGIRYDFLCANYTAFDQKTFICHFASEVDCKNSPKYWFRNEPLYKATTTTTVKPPPTTSTTPSPTTVPSRPKPLRKPVRRRRPQVDYYYYDEEYEDDYYEERNRRRKNRPRNRRPIYEDDYEEEDRFERPAPRPIDRYRERERDRLEEDDEYEERRPIARPMKTRNRNQERRPAPVDDDGRRGYYGGGAAVEERRRRPVMADERRRPPPVELEDDEDVGKPSRPVVSERRRVPAPDRDAIRRPLANDRRSFAGSDGPDRKPAKRPIYSDDEVDDEYDSVAPAYGASGRRGGTGGSDRGRQQQQQNDNVVTVKPAGGSIYGRPRAAPRINRPVPLNEKSKYAYGGSEGASAAKGYSAKPSTTAAPSEPEYYDEYEEVVAQEQPQPGRRDTAADKGPQTRKGSIAGSDYGDSEPTVAVGGQRKQPPRPSASSDVVYYDDVIVAKEDLPVYRPGPGNVRKPEQTERLNSRDNSELATGYNRYQANGEPKGRGSTKHQLQGKGTTSTTTTTTTSTVGSVSRDVDEPPVDGGDEELEDEYVPAVRPSIARPAAANLYANFKNKKQQMQQQQQQQQQQAAAAEPAPRQPLRSTKRPFLPSRGGNPYLARGLQPVGVAKQPAAKPSAPEAEKPAPFRIDLDSSTSAPQQQQQQVAGKRNQQQQQQQTRESAPAQQQQQQEVVNVKTLDELYDDEFDVTLNDALNPTLKPLTRSAPAPTNYFRNRYVHQPDTAEFVPFEPAYAPSEFRRSAAIRPPPAAIFYHTHGGETGGLQRQRYETYGTYQY